jgi:hypothetical protein
MDYAYNPVVVNMVVTRPRIRGSGVLDAGPSQLLNSGTNARLLAVTRKPPIVAVMDSVGVLDANHPKAPSIDNSALDVHKSRGVTAVGMDGCGAVVASRPIQCHLKLVGVDVD